MTLGCASGALRQSSSDSRKAFEQTPCLMIQINLEDIKYSQQMIQIESVNRLLIDALENRERERERERKTMIMRFLFEQNVANPLRT